MKSDKIYFVSSVKFRAKDRPSLFCSVGSPGKEEVKFIMAGKEPKHLEIYLKNVGNLAKVRYGW